MVVHVLFDKEVACWVKESRSYFTDSVEETPKGLLVTLKPHQESEVLQWLVVRLVIQALCNKYNNFQPRCDKIL